MGDGRWEMGDGRWGGSSHADEASAKAACSTVELGLAAGDTDLGMVLLDQRSKKIGPVMTAPTTVGLVPWERES